MEKWYSRIVEKIKHNQYSRLFVRDKSGLMNSIELRDSINGIYPVIHNYNSEIELRLFLRETDEPVLIITNNDLSLPTDFERKYKIINIDLKDVFPNLDERALDWLNINEIQELFYIYQKSNLTYKSLNYQETLRFVLKNLYELDFAPNRKEQIISFLIKYYFVNEALSGALQKYIEEYATGWKIDLSFFLNKKSFYNWLNKEWRRFFKERKSGINFNDRAIRYLLNDCFDQGFMEPIDLLREEVDKDFVVKEVGSNLWFNIGLKNAERITLLDDFDNSFRKLEELLDKDLNVRDWGTVAKTWSKLLYLKYKNNLDKNLEDISLKMDDKFVDFILKEYDNLAYDQRFYYAPLNNRILHYLVDMKIERFAIICFDCLSYKEWPIIKEYLSNKLTISFKEDFSIAVIPTTTSYSRKAIFSGQFPIELNNGGDEETFFKDFLKKNSGIDKEEVLYERSKNPRTVNFLGYTTVGLIYNFIDDLVHSSQNYQMLFNNIKTILYHNELDKVIENLLNDGFKVFFTSDHGYVFAEGNGYNPNRQLIEDRAARALLYINERLARNESFENQLILNFPNVIGDRYIVTMSDRRKFGSRESGFTHGGINIEEVIIPFIEVIG